MLILDSDMTAKKVSGIKRLGDPNRLYELARSKDASARIELGTAVTNLFSVADLTIREQEIVSDILISLLKQAEIDLRQALSERLAALKNAPLRVILHLSNDDIDVARTVLEQSPVLEEMDLLLIIEMQKSAYWQAIARRHDLKDSVVNALVNTHDLPTAREVVKNDHIMIPPEAFQKLATMAEGARDLSTPLLARQDIPQEVKMVLYAYASERVQEEMLGLGPVTGAMAEDVGLEFTGAARYEFRPTDMMIVSARALSERRQLSIDTMLLSLKNGLVGSFMAQVMVFADLTVDQVSAMVMDPTGELLAAFCRVHDADKKIFLKMLLLTQKCRTGDRMIDPGVLNTALTQFDRLTLEMCGKKLTALRATKPAEIMT